MKYLKLYTDNDGEPHFRDAEAGFELINFAPPAPPVGLSDYIPVARHVFIKTPSGWVGDWHPPPRRQFFCRISGKSEIATSDGEVAVFGSGCVFLLEDTTGKGHKNKTSKAEDFVAAIAQLDYLSERILEISTLAHAIGNCG